MALTPEYQRALRDKITRELQRRGWSYADLAKHTSPYLSRVAQGHQALGHKSAKQLIEALGLKLEFVGKKHNESDNRKIIYVRPKTIEIVRYVMEKEDYESQAECIDRIIKDYYRRNYTKA